MSSLIDGCIYDVFISYRQNDNRSGWVKDFVSALQEELAATVKDPISIYFDTNPHDGLLDTDNVGKSLEEKLRCVVLIPIVSQTYCDPKSFAWQHEFCSFAEHAKADAFGSEVRLRNGNTASRIVPILIHELDDDDRSLFEREFGGPIRGIEFIYQEPGVNRPLLASDGSANLKGLVFRNQINKCANAVKNIILSLKGRDIKSPGAMQTLKKPTKSSRRVLALAAAVVLLASIAVYVYLSFGGQASPPVRDRSIAVLAFEDLSADHDQGHLADGLADELIFTLSRIGSLKVVGRQSSFSYKGKNVAARQIGSDLNVATILSGSIRKSGDKIRVFAQLVNAEDGLPIWSDQFDRQLNDIFAVEEEIARSISNSLRIPLGDNFMKNASQVSNTEAYEVYRKARQKLALRGAENLKDARSLFEQSIRLDPAFSPAYSGLALVLSLLPYYSYSITSNEAVEYGMASVKKALQLDNQNVEALAVKGTLTGYYMWDWDTSGELLLEAYRLAPQNAEIVNFLGDYYRQVYDPKALEFETKAVSMDPLRAINYSDLSNAYGIAKDWPNALQYSRKAQKMSPYISDFVIVNLVDIYLELDSIKAVRRLLDSARHEGVDPLTSGILFAEASLSIKLGMTKDAIKSLNLLAPAARSGKYSSFMVCQLALSAGEMDLAKEMFHLAYERHDFYVTTNPLDEFVKHPEFNEYLEKPELKKLLELRKRNTAL